MLDYRKGMKDGSWQKLWHFCPDCPSYPSRLFKLETSQPSDDELCSRCWNLSRQERASA
jgi:hypothetical protein